MTLFWLLQQLTRLLIDSLIRFTISILSFVLFLILRRRTGASRLGLCPPIYIGECLDRVLGVGPELAQAQDTLAAAPEFAQAPAVLRRPSVSLRPQLGLSWLFRKLRGRRATTVASDVSNSSFWIILVSCVKLLNG